MELIVIKYMQLMCISFLMQNNADCAELTTQGEERNNLKLAACSADCLETAPNLNLTQCYQQCASQTESLADITAVEQSLNASFQLFCRDSKRLLIGVESDDVGHVENEKFIYLLVIRETQNTFGDHSALIADEPLIELRDLKSSESYNISVTIISSRYGAQYLGTRVFTTLREGYKPENVTEVRVEKYQAIEGDGENVTVTIGWEPARDHTCYYQLIAHGMGSAGDFHIEKGEEQDTKLNGNLHYHMLTWKFGETYAVAVRGVSFNDLEDEVIKSAPVWIVFDAPDCFEFHNDSENVCGPRKVEGLKSTYRLDDDDTFDIDFTWTKPDHPPDSYTIEIRDFFVELVGNKSDGLYVFNVNGTATSFLARGIRLKGERSRVNVTAYRNGQEEVAVNDDDLSGFKRTKPRSRLIDVLFYTFVTFTAVFLVVLFRVWQNRLSRIVTTLTQKQLDGMDLDLIKSITNHSMLEAIADLTRDTTMEVERESIELMEALGEGAFGLVKKAIVIRNGTKQQVAVKMLKNSANFDDIKQFHQEISVMKSVGTHPNVVSIIGHCTSNIEELMLLTEFCDAGSLLDLLRLEFTRQLNFYDKQRKMARGASAAPAKYPDNLHNFDGDGGKETSSYKNFGGASQLFVVNKMYDDLNNNNNNSSFNGESETHQRHQAALKAIELTATNALYFELSENDSKPVIVEMAEPENPRNFLASANLISFARQVSDGMDFLARKKVVHRDLAARNILVCSDKTAKIADFGLSRDIYQDNIYRKIGNGKLPIKWLAVESMTHQVYTSQSDVWSFGILLYEIVMLGATPYPCIGPEQLLKILNTGYRMEKPRHCHDALYDLMMSCWHANPTDRPSFEELSSKLNHFLLAENSWDERHVDLPALFDKCTSEMNYMKPIA